MRRFFARNMLFIIGINLLVKPIWVFAIDRNVQNAVGPESYGLYQALLNLAIVFQILLDFGLNSYNTNTISANPRRFARQFPMLFSARVLLLCLYSSVVLTAGYAMGYRGNALQLLGGVMTIQALTIILLFVRSNLAALQHYKLDGLLSVIDRFLMIIICGAALFSQRWSANFSIEWFVYCQIGCYLIAILIGLWMLRRVIEIPKYFSLHLGFVGGMLKRGAPFALLAFLMSVYMRSDAFLVERICHDTDKTQAGIYASAVRLLDVTNMISIMFSSTLMPLFGRMIADKQSVAPIVRLSSNILLPASFLLTVLAWAVGAEVMHVLYTNPSKDYALIVGLLMTTAPAYSIMYIYSTLLTANGNIALLNKLATGAAIISVILNLILINKYMATGAALTACIVMWLLAIGYIFFSVKKVGLPYTPKWVFAHGLYLILLVVVAIICHLYIPSWQYQAIIICIIAAVLIVMLRLITPQSMKQLLKKNESS